MKNELNKKYDFKIVENNRYQNWLNGNFFAANRLSLKPFTIVIPPPNVTGKLHLGHAWDNTIQDIIIRRKRMQGYNALFLPGMDHAGIATQAKIDAKLKEKNTNRYDIGRKEFLKVAWSWKEEYSQKIRKQWELLGISVDYTKERFTLDDSLSKAVNHVFISMYNEGLIYRGNRIIHWDVEAKTALSNIEVEYKEELTKLYYFKYPLVENDDEYLIIATTRPETMFADQAIIVHPDDNRFKKYIGKKVYIPGLDIKIPIISDSYVDRNFGSGVVKVTPAHDANDFEIGKRHNLKMPLCMNEDGTMNEMAFEFNGFERFLCREKLVEKLKKLNFIEKIEDYKTSIGYSERTGIITEPRLSLQWFVKMDKIAKDALKSKVKFFPIRFKKIFDHWMNNAHDWCISRQLWWGHRIPAWYKDDKILIQDDSPGEDWIQDEDVLDTWFSSALWPFSTLGWPDKTIDFKMFYPTNLLVTGYDIIFFWVSRMIFQGRLFTKKDPFNHVLLHGLIRDEKGRKMSKSLNNGIDPTEVIKKYGVDSLRYFLTTNSAPGADLRYDEKKVESSWNFLNKLWNISRFVISNLNDDMITFDLENLSVFDSWILTKLSDVIKTANSYYDNYDLHEAAKVLYNFIWNEFAAWYLEISKISLNNVALNNKTSSILAFILNNILKLMHPFIPFITDMLYVKFNNKPTIMLENWPDFNYENIDALNLFGIFEECIVKIRNLKAENKVSSTKRLLINIVSSDLKIIEFINNYFDYFVKFLKCEYLIVSTNPKIIEETIMLFGKNYSIYIRKDEIIDENEKKQLLLKQMNKLEEEIKRCLKILNNPAFLQKAPKEKIDDEKRKYQEYLKSFKKIESELKE